MGVVHQIQRSEDNAVRSAVVRLKLRKDGNIVQHTTVIRPVEKLYFLELNELEDQNAEIPHHGLENVVTK